MDDFTFEEKILETLKERFSGAFKDNTKTLEQSIRLAHSDMPRLVDSVIMRIKR